MSQARASFGSLGDHKYLVLLLVLNVAFQLISDVTAQKLILIAGLTASVTVIYFPITYLISDILTEVYGYAKARAVLWATLIASVMAGATYALAVSLPSSPAYQNDQAFAAIFSQVPRILVGGWIAVFTGEIANNFLMAKLKVWTSGRFLWLRTISSTIVGQGLNTIVFYTIGLYGMIPNEILVASIITGWAIKVAVEVLLTPVTYVAVGWLKRVEGVDHYDRQTDFNPFRVTA